MYDEGKNPKRSNFFVLIQDRIDAMFSKRATDFIRLQAAAIYSDNTKMRKFSFCRLIL